jgi:hypothetical protein
MALFKNREKRTIAQLEDYYSSRHKSTKAWAMAFLSLLITVGILSILFFGGRWLYRTFTDDQNSTSTTETGTQVEEAKIPGSAITDQEQGQSNQETASVDTETVVAGGTVSDEAASTSVPNVNIGQTGGNLNQEASNDIPNTGSSDILLLTPIIAVVVGYLISRKRQINNL